jgi:Zn finger protein HypA/HybF involved in hydrogenase expression
MITVKMGCVCGHEWLEQIELGVPLIVSCPKCERATARILRGRT